jgi:hypothetical protein
MARVAALDCVLCRHLGMEQEGRTTVHHIREGQGAAQRAQDVLTVAVCAEHHQGGTGIHGLGVKGFYRRYKLDEIDLLAMTLEALEA